MKERTYNLGKSSSEKRAQSGFTIIELSLVLIIFGVFTSLLLYALQLYYHQNDTTKTHDSLTYSEAAIMEFRSLKGRYPCPADPSLGPRDANYGIENCTASGGIREVTGRDADTAPGPDKILVGAVPFATLIDPDGNPATEDGITQTPYVESMSLDGWNRKLTYAVTKNLISVSTYADSYGAIDVVDEHNDTLLGTPGTAHMVLVSHGENGKGAHTREGSLVDSCNPVVITPPPPNPPPFPNSELENCDNDGIFLSGLRVEDQQSYNDDITAFLLTRITAFWTYTGITASGVPMVANTNSGKVGIGTDVPDERLDVSGDIKAAQAQAESFCGHGGTDCMPSKTIAGNQPAMRCGTFNTAITSIENNAVKCAPVFTGAAMTCPTDQYAVGISNLQGILCTPLPH